MTKTEHIIGMMIEKAFETIDSRIDLFQKLNDIKTINKEHRTIQLRFPRQTGQTTAVINVAKQYFKRPLYVCTDMMNQHVKHHIDYDVETLTYSQIRNPDNLIGKMFNCVIIDNASIIGECDIKEIFENKTLQKISSLDRHFLYILIG